MAPMPCRRTLTTSRYPHRSFGELPDHLVRAGVQQGHMTGIPRVGGAPLKRFGAGRVDPH
jgi:hypothetical protein